MTEHSNQKSGTDVGQFAVQPTKQRVVPMEEMMHGLGLAESIPGGPRRVVEMASLMQSLIPGITCVPLVEQQQAEAPLVQSTPVINQDLYDGDSLTEEMLERLESTDWESIDEDIAGEIFSRILEKEVPDELKDRAVLFYESKLEEGFFKRLLAGIAKKVRHLVGSKAEKARRKRRTAYKTQKFHIRKVAAKRMRTAPAKMKAAKTKKKHELMNRKKASKKPGVIKRIASKLSSINKNVKKKASMLFKKNESSLVNELHALLLESQIVKPGVRDEIMVNLGEIISCMEQLFDEDVMEMMVDQYHLLAEAYCNNQLQEGLLDEASFVARCAPLAKVIARCYEELDAGKNEELPA